MSCEGNRINAMTAICSAAQNVNKGFTAQDAEKLYQQVKAAHKNMTYAGMTKALKAGMRLPTELVKKKKPAKKAAPAAAKRKPAARPAPKKPVKKVAGKKAAR